KFRLSTNRNSEYCWFNGLPPQKQDSRIEYHESFDGQLSQLLYDCKLSVGEYEIKVFYNQEYKTITKCFQGKAHDNGESPILKNTLHFVPMKEEEILHFMNLFDGYKK
nr:hypothetical protein [Candidatus Paceibacterota bacterium]